jgi:hypothetical protein
MVFVLRVRNEQWNQSVEIRRPLYNNELLIMPCTKRQSKIERPARGNHILAGGKIK